MVAPNGLFSAKCVIVGDGAVGKVLGARTVIATLSSNHALLLDVFIVFLCQGRVP